MDTILVKIFATALALSEVTTQPQGLKTHFDSVTDRDEVVQVLRDGCAHMRKAFDIESINVDDLIATALDDPAAVGGNIKAFHGLNFADLNTAYHQFCKNETIEHPVVDLGEVIDTYNNAAADLPDPARLKGTKLPSLTTVLDGKSAHFADVFLPGNRRVWVPLAEIPDFVQKAFIAAEDRRFYQHHGVDERGIIRAFIGNLADSGRPQGGSTITQQVVKNLLVGDDVSYERKIREMIVASRLENTLSKNEILELYMNSAYLGRGAWGVEMAARVYFGKSAKALTLPQGAMLAGLLKGPSFFNPDRHPDRARDRLAYVLGRMQEDGVISAAEKDSGAASLPQLAAFSRSHRDRGYHFVDFLGREAKADGIPNLTADSYTVHSTIDAQLQRDAEAALQEGLARYETANGRLQFRGPEANIAAAVDKFKTRGQSADPPWQQALNNTHLPLYDVHWTPAVVVQKGDGKKGGDGIRVGLSDGRIMSLTNWGVVGRRGLSLYDVVYVHVVEGRSGPPPAATRTGNTRPPAPSGGAVAQLRVRPKVEGAALVLENRTGRILAMAGSFSYPMSQLNRTSQTQRQPGSAIKPITYLTALQKGLQPNTLVRDDPITLPPIGAAGSSSRSIIAREFGGTAREEDFWSPRNANYASGGIYTLRRGLENSVNVVTAHLLDGGIDYDPATSLDQVCATAVASKIYPDCVRYYPFVLGAQPVRMIDLIAFYAAVANEGARPQPHGIDSIELNGKTIYEYPKAPLPMIGAADRVSFYQLKTILQGVVARGTARAIGALSPYVAGKTGTTEDAVDGWFVGFTNDVTIAVWVGYDNDDGKRRSLGSNATGAQVALPIFQPILEAVWSRNIAPKAPLAGPSPETQRQIADVAIDYVSGSPVAARAVDYGGRALDYGARTADYGNRGGFIEHFRKSAGGQVEDTQYQLVSREEAYAYREQPQDQGFFSWFGNGWGNNGWGQPQPAQRAYFPNRGWGYQQPPQPQQVQPAQRGYYNSQPVDPRQSMRRRDPDYFWGRFN